MSELLNITRICLHQYLLSRSAEHITFYMRIQDLTTPFLCGAAPVSLTAPATGFELHTAVALTSVTILGGGLSNVVFNALKRTTRSGKPLVDWDLVMVMEPSTIAGAILGGYLNKVRSFAANMKPVS